MRRMMLASGLVIVVVILARSVPAQPPGRPGRGGPPGGGFPVLPIVAALDADGDGELSAREIDNAATALRTLDRNNDGKLTRDEYLPAFREGGQAGPNPAELVARMMAFDKNGDGKLSKDELPERMQGLLERADANKDGFVDKDELTKLVQQQAGAGAARARGLTPWRRGPWTRRRAWTGRRGTSPVLAESRPVVRSAWEPSDR